MNKNKNFQVNKSVLNFIHARDFWKEGEAEQFKNVVTNLKYQPQQYGFEIPQFNMIDPELEMVFGEMLGDWIKLDEEKSGVFRIPYPVIHFEDFASLHEWRCAVALEDNIFKIYNHISGAKDARSGYKFDYTKRSDWKIETQIKLKQNDAVFYRPWMFHMFLDKPLYCFKIMVEQ